MKGIIHYMVGLQTLYVESHDGSRHLYHFEPDSENMVLLIPIRA